MDKTGFEREIGFGLTGLALGGGTVVVLPLAAPILRPLAKTAIKGGILAYQGAAGLLEGVGDRVAEAIADSGGVATQAREGATHA
ncbi:MAG: hypothetical protein WBX30_27620 [Stellaceae bacterium]